MGTSERSEYLADLEAALERQGAQNVDVGGTVGLQTYGEQDSADVSVDVSYTGDQEWLRHAASETDGISLLDTSTTEWPGGDILVDGEVRVEEGASGGATPGVHVDSRCSTTPETGARERNAHCAHGDTYPVVGEAGITDQCEVATWIVRNWEPVPGVPALLVLRYIPNAKAEGLEWWSGYVKAAPEGGLGSTDWQGLRRRVEASRIQHDGAQVPISYDDGSGWLGWDATTLPTEAYGIQVYTSVGTEVAALDNQEAGRITERFAQAALEARREVVR